MGIAPYLEDRAAFIIFKGQGWGKVVINGGVNTPVLQAMLNVKEV